MILLLQSVCGVCKTDMTRQGPITWLNATNPYAAALKPQCNIRHPSQNGSRNSEQACRANWQLGQLCFYRGAEVIPPSASQRRNHLNKPSASAFQVQGQPAYSVSRQPSWSHTQSQETLTEPCANSYMSQTRHTVMIKNSKSTPPETNAHAESFCFFVLFFLQIQ